MFLHAFHALVLIWFAELTKVQMRNIQLWRLSTKPLTALKVIGFAKSSKMKTKEKGTKCLALHSNWIDLDSWMQQFAKVYHSCRYHKANSFVVRIVHFSWTASYTRWTSYGFPAWDIAKFVRFFLLLRLSILSIFTSCSQFSVGTIFLPSKISFTCSSIL